MRKSVTVMPKQVTDVDRSLARITVAEVARRLGVGRFAVYSMLEKAIIPGVRLGRRWIITRQAYEHWERTCGMRADAGLNGHLQFKSTKTGSRGGLSFPSRRLLHLNDTSNNRRIAASVRPRLPFRIRSGIR